MEVDRVAVVSDCWHKNRWLLVLGRSEDTGTSLMVSIYTLLDEMWHAHDADNIPSWR